jgi:hypothetical protein
MMDKRNCVECKFNTYDIAEQHDFLCDRCKYSKKLYDNFEPKQTDNKSFADEINEIRKKVKNETLSKKEIQQLMNAINEPGKDKGIENDRIDSCKSADGDGTIAVRNKENKKLNKRIKMLIESMKAIVDSAEKYLKE